MSRSCSSGRRKLSESESEWGGNQSRRDQSTTTTPSPPGESYQKNFGMLGSWQETPEDVHLAISFLRGVRGEYRCNDHPYKGTFLWNTRRKTKRKPSLWALIIFLDFWTRCDVIYLFFWCPDLQSCLWMIKNLIFRLTPPRSDLGQSLYYWLRRLTSRLGCPGGVFFRVFS